MRGTRTNTLGKRLFRVTAARAQTHSGLDATPGSRNDKMPKLEIKAKLQESVCRIHHAQTHGQMHTLLITLHWEIRLLIFNWLSGRLFV